ncbi:hypothetical protein HDU79_000269 [Rhizoclosmatium sp. JEL0117]|nr:hypothetical protein HDU79_000269 [Rhizoclosmatium sp. JEL0117]
MILTVRVLLLLWLSMAAAVPIGGVCGGGTQNAPTCDSNLDCFIQPDSTLGTQGICVLNQSGLGGPCNQPIQNSAICRAGLVCIDPTPMRPGESGTCQEGVGNLVSVGGVCGGGTANEPRCEPNLDCVSSNQWPGSKGICTLKMSDVGGPCDQPIRNSAVCKPGLICSHDGNFYPGAYSQLGSSGTCRRGVVTTTYCPPTPYYGSKSSGAHVYFAVIGYMVMIELVLFFCN